MQSKRPGRKNPLTKLLTEAFDNLMRSVMICLPGHVVSFDEKTQLAQVQCGIQRVINGSGVSISILENVPVHFSGSDGWYFWHEISEGTEGIILFSQRAMDLWIERGGVVKPHDLRMFSESDAFFVPGIRSKAGPIPAFKNEGIGMSDYSGANFIHVKNGSIDIKTDTLNMECNVTHDGNMNRTGDTSLTGGVTNNGKDIGDTHKHDGSPTAPTGPKSPTGEVL